MTFSEFGRRVAEDGSAGSDHGTAAPMFVVGDGVAGGLYGEHPKLDANSLDADKNMVRAVDYREVYAAILDGCFRGPSSTEMLRYSSADGLNPAVPAVRAAVVVLMLALGPVALPARADAPEGRRMNDMIVGPTFVAGSASLNTPGQPLRIRTGDTLVWTNLDAMSHDVAFDALPFSAYLAQPGDSAH